MKKKAETYETMVKHYNRHISRQTTCECGKILNESQMDRHLTTGVHKLLLYYKQQQDDMRKEEGKAKPEKRYLNTWDKIVLEKTNA
jgi:hypothetical protein